MVKDSGPHASPGRRHLSSRLREADDLLDEVREQGRRSSSVVDLTIAGVLDLAPGVGAVLQRLSDEVRDRRIAHLADAARALVQAVATVQEDVRHRLADDPRFADFVERLVNESLRAEQRDKIEYYARLLRNTAPTNGPDADERIRLLDALDAMRLHHLRLFHAAASTVDAPPNVRERGDVWVTIAHVTGTPPDAAKRDWSTLEQLLLVEAGGWASPTNLRLKLTEFGLRFEEFVAAERPVSRPRWEAQLGGHDETFRELAVAFGEPGRDYRVVRESGGYYVVSPEFDAKDDVVSVRRLAEAFLDRVRSARIIDLGVSEERRIEIRSIRERQGSAVIVHDVEASDVGARPVEDWPTPPISSIAEAAIAQDPAVARAISLLQEGSWPSLVETMNIIEREHGGPLRGYPGVSTEDAARFDAVAAVQGLDRESPGSPASMSRDQARAVVTGALRAWLYIRAGIWTRNSSA